MNKIGGSITALVTPFKGGVIDEEALRSLVEWQIGAGTHGLLACGTTGESPSLSICEHLRVIEIVVETSKKRVPVIAGASSSNTVMAVNLGEHAQQAGADAILVAAPCYNKPTQEGIYQHFVSISNAVQIPIILYNIPQRTAVDISIDTVMRLKEKCPDVIGTKDATANLARMSSERLSMPRDWIMLSGDDATALGYMVHGGHGCISALANVVPELFSLFQEACMNGDFKRALELQESLEPLRRALFLETNPMGIKFALNRLGHIDSELRLPMVQCSSGTQKEILLAMKALGLLS